MPPPTWLERLVVIAGQSNAVGQGVPSNDDDGGDGGVPWEPNALATINTHIAPAPATPPVYTDVARRDMQSYDTIGNPAYGVELSLARFLHTFGPSITTPIAFSKMAINSSGMEAHWKPSSAYPAAAPNNLFGQFTTFIDAEQVATGKTLGCLVWIQGETDAGSDANSALFAANVDAFFGSLRAAYGEDWLLVLVRMSPNMTLAPITGTWRDRINQAYEDYAAAHSANTIVVNTDGMPVSAGQIHYIGDEYRTLGNRISAAMLAKTYGAGWASNRNGASLSLSPAPILQNYVEPTIRAASGTASLTIRSPSDSRPGDIELLIVGRGITEPVDDPTLSSAAGFVQVGAVSLADISTSSQKLAVYQRTVTQEILDANGGRMPEPVVAGSANGTQRSAVIVTVRGSSGILANVDSASTAFNASISMTGVDTTGTDNCLVLYISSTFASGVDTRIASLTNATLSGFSVRRDSTNNTNQNISIAAGVMTTGGATGTATGTRNSSGQSAHKVIAFAPAA